MKGNTVTLPQLCQKPGFKGKETSLITKKLHDLRLAAEKTKGNLKYFGKGARCSTGAAPASWYPSLLLLPCPAHFLVLLELKICFLSQHCPGWDKPTAWVCPVCFIYNMSKIATLCKSASKFLALARRSDPRKELETRHQSTWGWGLYCVLRSSPLLRSALHGCCSGRRGRRACLSPVLHTGRDTGNGDRRTSLTWERSEGKSLSEPSPFLHSQRMEWVTLLE